MLRVQMPHEDRRASAHRVAVFTGALGAALLIAMAAMVFESERFYVCVVHLSSVLPTWLYFCPG